jgi:hypothetical protein
VKRLFRLFFALAVGIAPSLAPYSARADDPPPGPVFLPTPVQLTIPPFGEPTGVGTGLAPALAVLPLRLSLMSSVFPMASLAPGDPFGCKIREEMSANSNGGFPVQHQVFLPLTSRLVLHGFSTGGCPLDAGAGGGISYTMPVARNVWLVPSAGVYSQPNGITPTTRTRSDARVDLVFKTYGGRALGVGVGRQGFKITGTW